MATETVIHDDDARIGTKAEELRDRALRLIEDMGEQSGKAHAVASAGRSFVGEAAITELHLFEVIEDILSDAVLQNELRRTIVALAAVGVEVHHA